MAVLTLEPGPNRAVIFTHLDVTSWGSPQPRATCNEDSDPPSFRPLYPFTPFPHTVPNQRLQTIHGLHVVYHASNILDVLRFQHPIDH
jgi:hypothetical protein